MVPLCPKIQHILEQRKEEASYCVPTFSGNGKFQVMGPGGQSVCDLNALICACRRWELTGIPCTHGVSAMTYTGLEAKMFTNVCYSIENYLKCYSNCIEPLNGPHLWAQTGLPHVLPPLYAKQPGQKQHKRRLEEGEKNKKASLNVELPSKHKLGKKYQVLVKCGNCGMVGHNRRSCKQSVSNSKLYVYIA